MEMANVVGKYVKTDDINFSFFFSDKSEVSHGIRAKVKWNREKLSGGSDGYFELHGDYPYVSSKSIYVDESRISEARKFFRKYKVLFAAVWEFKLEQIPVQDYFRNLISFKDLLSEFEGISKQTYDKIQLANNVEELEDVVRKCKCFNMHD